MLLWILELHILKYFCQLLYMRGHVNVFHAYIDFLWSLHLTGFDP